MDILTLIKDLTTHADLATMFALLFLGLSVMFKDPVLVGKVLRKIFMVIVIGFALVKMVV